MILSAGSVNGWPVYNIRFSPGEEINARLEALGRDPARIDLIINSHFHFDHVGGNALIPNATMIVQRREWEARLNADFATAHGFNPADFDIGHRLLLVDGEHDVFGDGSVVCMPTPGHTPGHQSLRLRLASGETVLAADACYFCQTLRERRLPRYVFDREAMLGITRPLASSRSERLAHHLRSRPRILADGPASSGGDPLKLRFR